MDQGFITIFGASGQVGRAIVEKLAGMGFRIRAAVRHPDEALFLKPFGDVGQIQTTYADLSQPKTVARAILGAATVINCVGILFEQRGGQNFSKIQAEGPGLIARAAKQEGVKILIHISAIGADERSPSHYGRTKRAGEMALKKVFPKVVIFRPSIIFGPNDSFFNLFAKLARIPLAPLVVVGPNTRFQPVYVEDVVGAITLAVTGPEKLQGKIFELGGPEVYTFRKLLRYMLRVTGRHKFILSLPFALAGFFGWWFQLWAKILPFAPPLTLDQVRLLKTDNVVSDGAKTFANLGITPTPLEAVVPDYLVHFRPKGQFS